MPDIETRVMHLADVAKSEASIRSHLDKTHTLERIQIFRTISQKEKEKKRKKIKNTESEAN